MKKILKSLLFVCSINVAAFSDLHLDEYYFTNPTMDNEDIEKVKECMMLSKAHIENLYGNTDVSRFAESLIDYDLDQDPRFWSVYKDIFNILKPIGIEYLTKVYEYNPEEEMFQNMCREKWQSYIDSVTEYYMMRASDEYDRCDAVKCLKDACKEKSRYTRGGDQCFEEDLVLSFMKQDLNHLTGCQLNECVECKTIIDNFKEVVSNAERDRSADITGDIINSYESPDNKRDDLIGGIIDDYESSDNESDDGIILI